MTPLTTTKPTTIAQRNEQRARRLIEPGLCDPASVTTTTARLIAATIHAGPYTALGRFAACGAFDAARIRDELDRLSSDQIPKPWRRALGTYITEAHRGTA